MYDLYLLPTKAVDYKLLTNIKKEDSLGWFLTYQNFRLCLSLTDFSRFLEQLRKIAIHAVIDPAVTDILMLFKIAE